MNKNDDDELYEIYAVAKLIEISGKVLNNILKIITTVILTIILFIPRIVKKYKKKKSQEKFTFDEFKDIDEIKEKEDNSLEELNSEWKVLNSIAYDMYKDKKNNIFDIANEQKKAVRHMQNFDFLDSVKVDNEVNEEGIYIHKIREKINGFEPELFKNWSKQIFKCIKLGKEEELKIVKKFINDQLYDNLVNQKNNFTKDGLDFVTEDLIIEDVTIANYAETMNKEEIKICVEARMKEYILDKRTQSVVRGNNEKSYNKKIIMTFIKQDICSREGFITNCPSCGAENAQVEFGNCKYCNNLIFPITYNWILIKFEII